MPSLEQARAWYAPQDPVHGFDHVLRVLELAERLGRELGADLEVLRAAALLHDTVEDTSATQQEIEEKFGPEIAALVDGLTKIAKLDVRHKRADVPAEGTP